MSVMHSHNTTPNMAQKYKRPIWQIPDLTNLESSDASTIKGNADKLYRSLRDKYILFANSFLERIGTLN